MATAATAAMSATRLRRTTTASAIPGCTAIPDGAEAPHRLVLRDRQDSLLAANGSQWGPTDAWRRGFVLEVRQDSLALATWYQSGPNASCARDLRRTCLRAGPVLLNNCTGSDKWTSLRVRLPGA